MGNAIIYILIAALVVVLTITYKLYEESKAGDYLIARFLDEIKRLNEKIDCLEKELEDE